VDLAGPDSGLPPGQEARFSACLLILSAKRESFHVVGAALEEIQTLKLFRGRFETFEHCAAGFGFKKTHAYRLIASAEKMRILSPIGDEYPLPRSEFQVRPLALLRADQTVEAWKEVCARAAAKGMRITAALVQTVVKELWPDLAIASPSSAQPPNETRRLIRAGLNFASSALEKLCSPSDSGPTARELLEKTVSSLAEALENEPAEY
jgi:hypothetical protein